MDQAVFQKIKSILAKELNCDINLISEQSKIMADLGADSLDLAEISLIVREEFQYDFTDTDMSNIRTVGDMYQILSRALAKDAA